MGNKSIDLAKYISPQVYDIPLSKAKWNVKVCEKFLCGKKRKYIEVSVFQNGMLIDPQRIPMREYDYIMDQYYKKGRKSDETFLKISSYDVSNFQRR